MLLTETKIPYAMKCHNLLGYDVVFSKATVTAAGVSQGRGSDWSCRNGCRDGFSSKCAFMNQTW